MRVNNCHSYKSHTWVQNTVTEECHLCGREAELLDSHIIPRFAFVWLKKTSASPFFRNPENPNTRIQDYHEKLLCEDCEQSFSDYEREFASNIFHPFVDGESASFEYEEWLQRFIMSISWRIIVSEMTDLTEFDDFHADAFRDAEKIWRKILNGDCGLSSDVFTHHVFFLDDIAEADNPEDVPDDWEFYIDRGLDATPVHGTRTTAIYFKLPKLLFFSCIQPPSDSELKDTKVGTNGEIGPPQELGPHWGTFLIDRARRVTDRTVSSSEQEKIKQRILQDPEEAVKSDSFKTYAKSMKRQIENHDPTDYLDEKCPVCYTFHRVVEFLPERPLMKDEIRHMAVKNPFLEGVYLDDELAVSGMSENAAPSFVLSTESKTRIVSLYRGEGWIIEREIEHPEDVEPEEFGQMILEGHRESLVEWANQQRENPRN